ncbi:putative cobalt transporter subunit (CbtA) [Candidatus Nitrososphaera evergladensis SR1]|jgi:predicted cobalt transporter CbtA|uniref:Putative cobalt transporter subunit (CbtA) n=1 Tax=Candidatus Nitrososphaera evergladensis SR1 TaxID=1459636 RepID=A0A075MV76_9ARCH|nr:CbtA family protein [Candidatus Nitrososphaera evergladensis]AIF84557.1 putative cobalt transporter subunit (CbtA) [Candidatus Nitrososphaera evergladensis SR1]
MKTLTFIAISLLSGIIAGTILALVNQSVVLPFIERAIAIENQNAVAQGEMIDPTAMDAYRLWQKEGSVAAGALLGLSYGALLGVVFAYARKSLPGKNNIAKAVLLAGIMWIVIYLAVAVKYPANPPAVGNPDTIYLRMTLYVAMLAISGAAAIGSAFLYKKMGPQKSARKAVVPAVYVAVVIAAVFALPANPDPVTAPMDLVNGFRIASASTMAMFWLVLGAVLGVLWDKTKPHETATVKNAP